MLTKYSIVQDLKAIGVTAGMRLIVHASLRSMGAMENGASTLLEAFREVLGAEGTLMVPTFTGQLRDPALSENAPTSLQSLAELREKVPLFDRAGTPVEIEAIGVFAETVRRLPEAHRSDHPALSFAAFGPLARNLTENAPLHYPLGSSSPLAKLHQNRGHILLIGVGQIANSSIHLAEVWANAPYAHRSRLVKTSEKSWTQMKGSPECSAGFARIEPILQQARLLRTGLIGEARSQLMRQEEVVSLAMAMLQGSGDALLCNNPYCPHCVLASKFTSRREE